MAIYRDQWLKLLFPGGEVVCNGLAIGLLFVRFSMDVDTPLKPGMSSLSKNVRTDGNRVEVA